MFNYIVVHVPVTLTSQTMQWINVCVKASVTDCKAYFYQLAFCQAIYAFYCVGFFSLMFMNSFKHKIQSFQSPKYLYYIFYLFTYIKTSISTHVKRRRIKTVARSYFLAIWIFFASNNRSKSFYCCVVLFLGYHL